MVSKQMLKHLKILKTIEGLKIEQRSSIFDYNFKFQEWAANYWHSLGAPKEKLVIGMPFYGRGFTLAKYTNSVIGSQTTAPSVAGAFTREGGFLAFFEICQLLQGGATRHWLTGQQVPYLTLGSQWVGYDDRASLTQKVSFLPIFPRWQQTLRSAVTLKMKSSHFSTQMFDEFLA